MTRPAAALTASTVACPFCGAEQQVDAWRRGVASQGEKCTACNAFVATGCWEAA